MATVFMSWNIEHFGAARRYRGTHSINLCQFIAQVALIEQVDVLAIMELQSNASQSLINLQNSLSAAFTNHNNQATVWHCAWIPAAWVTDPSGRRPIPGPTPGPGWTTCSNNESYAVLWNSTRVNLQNLGPNPVPAGHTFFMGQFCALVQTGRQTLLPQPYVAGSSKYGIDCHNLPLPAIPAVHPIDPNLINQPLPFPNNTGFVSFGAQVADNGARRPFYFNIILANNTIVPVCVFHAPYNSTRRLDSGEGVGSTRAVRQLAMAQAAYSHAQGIIAGDFNEDVKKYMDNIATQTLDLENPYLYLGNFTANNEQLGANYAFFRNQYDADQGTMVSNNPKPNLAANDPRAYSGPSFDNIFHFGMNPATTGNVVDLITLIQQNGLLADAFQVSFGREVFALNNPFNLTAQEITDGKIMSAAKAAEVLDTIVSDHQPVVLRFT